MRYKIVKHYYTIQVKRGILKEAEDYRDSKLNRILND